MSPEELNVRKAIADVELIRRVLDQAKKNDSPDQTVGLFGVTLTANIILQSFALAGAVLVGVGGALDSVVEGRTGTFVTGSADGEIVTGFAEAFARFDSADYDPSAIRAHAETFSREAFRRNMADVVTKTVEHRARQ